MGRPRDGSRRSDSAGVAISTCGRGDHDSLPDDAVKSYYAAVALVTTTIGQDFSDGLIDGAAKGRFETIRQRRRGYLHLWSRGPRFAA